MHFISGLLEDLCSWKGFSLDFPLREVGLFPPVHPLPDDDNDGYNIMYLPRCSLCQALHVLFLRISFWKTQSVSLLIGEEAMV